MPNAINLIHVVHEFYIPDADYVSGIPFHNGFASNDGDGYAIFNAGLSSSSASIPASTIILPNGSKYDPFQTYRAPNTPGTCDVTVHLIPHWQYIQASITTLELTEAAIQRYHKDAMTALGERGTLYGYDANNNAATATARLIGITANQTYPKQVPSIIGGSGPNTPGIKYMEMTFKFDLITTWTFTF